ncbi:glycosyltransferase family 2 protein [Colwellia sp. BRX10-3]|uniref:glycosyltransferase family 2 protein n=1 Tax=Colwellia sp. BRX10-3 TaxID=2759844 RepID=UPI0015F75606|nr:glycosyltransferase family 2 protein [Colwellia sp. BRX10-3]MBA6391071.1 glycosyltransferase family 2 protein [Colwellia sp. BRX10-3]
MSNSTVSIIIPVYNASKYIARALDSIQKQTFNSYEVIVVDDGSTDDSVLIVQEHSLSIRLLHKINGGASSARNVGIKAAKGKYLAFLDADDEWLPSKLSVQMMHMEENKSLIAIYCKDYNLRSQPKAYTHNLPELIEKNCEDIFMHPYNLTTSSFLIESTVIREVGGVDEDLKTAEDIDLYLKVSLLGKIGELSENLCIKYDIEYSLGTTLSSYEDNLNVITRFFNKNVDCLPVSFEKKFRAMNVYVLNSWCEDLLWKNKYIHALNICFRSLNVKMSYRGIHLLFKIIIKYCICFVRSKY